MAVSDPGEFVISYVSTVPREGYPMNHPEVVIGSTVSGDMSEPIALTAEATWLTGIAMNPAGHTIVWACSVNRAALKVTTRAPHGTFGPFEALHCGPDSPRGYAGVVSPAGQGAMILGHDDLMSGKQDEPTLISEDLGVASEGPADCPSVSAEPPAERRRTKARRGLGLRVRIARGGRVSQNGSLELLATCRQACRVRARGSVKFGRRSPLRFSPKRVSRARPLSRRVRVVLTPRRARAPTGSLARGKRGRATIRVKATGRAGQRQTVFLRHVAVRR